MRDPLRFHVLTAVTRPENLAEMAWSIWRSQGDSTEIVWHWKSDPERSHVGGQAVKNVLLDGVPDGWVFILDDDTVMHPGLVATLEAELAGNSELRALVVSQRRADGHVLRAAPGFMVTGLVDIGQAVLRRDLIGEQRIPETYDGDGDFLCALLCGTENVRYVDEILSYHNALEEKSQRLEVFQWQSV